MYEGKPAYLPESINATHHYCIPPSSFTLTPGIRINPNYSWQETRNVPTRKRPRYLAYSYRPSYQGTSSCIAFQSLPHFLHSYVHLRLIHRTNRNARPLAPRPPRCLGRLGRRNDSRLHHQRKETYNDSTKADLEAEAARPTVHHPPLTANSASKNTPPSATASSSRKPPHASKPPPSSSPSTTASPPPVPRMICEHPSTPMQRTAPSTPPQPSRQSKPTTQR